MNKLHGGDGVKRKWRTSQAKPGDRGFAWLTACFARAPISFPESLLPLSSGGTGNKDLWDTMIHLTCAIRLEVQESWRPLVETWSRTHAQ